LQQRFLNFILNTPAIRLTLPSHEISAVVFEN
jgi:hypothetical protein